MQKDFSIVCLYNDKEILNRCLLKSLKEQTVKYELILVDNTKNRFKSISAGLNYGGDKASNEYIIFVHQDVCLSSNKWLEKTKLYLGNIDKLGIAGVAGVSWNKKNRFRNIIIDKNKKWGNKINKPEIVQTVDECLFIIPKEIFKKMNFDSKICDSWHLYAVDYCLSVRNLGLFCYVLPLKIIHQNTAFTKFKFSKKEGLLSRFSSFPPSYYHTLSKIIEKHKKRYKIINTSCGSFRTHLPISLYRIKAIIDNVIKEKNET